MACSYLINEKLFSTVSSNYSRRIKKRLFPSLFSILVHMLWTWAHSQEYLEKYLERFISELLLNMLQLLLICFKSVTLYEIFLITERWIEKNRFQKSQINQMNYQSNSILPVFSVIVAVISNKLLSCAECHSTIFLTCWFFGRGWLTKHRFYLRNVPTPTQWSWRVSPL